MQFISLAIMTSDIELWRACNVIRNDDGAVIFTNLSGVPGNALSLIEGGNIEQLLDGEAFKAYAHEGSWAVERKDLLEARWASVQADAAYKSLATRLGWSEAFDCLKRKTKQKKSSAYAHPLARFRLVTVIGANVGEYIAAKESGRAPFVLGKAESRKHLAHVQGLLKLVEPIPGDLDIFYFGDTAALVVALKSLKAVLEAGARHGKYKEREDESLRERRFIKRVATDLRDAFGDVSQVLVFSIASMVDYTVNETTLRRVISAINSGKPRAR